MMNFGSKRSEWRSWSQENAIMSRTQKRGATKKPFSSEMGWYNDILALYYKTYGLVMADGGY